MMKLKWLTVLLYCVAWRTLCAAIPQKLVHTSSSPSGLFCITVGDEEPPDLSSEDRQLWYSPATVVIQLLVNVTRYNPYTTCASKSHLTKQHLTKGKHQLEYNETVSNGFMSLAVTLDGSLMKILNCTEQVYPSAGVFNQIKVFTKGPLDFNWDEPCPAPPTTTPAYSTKLNSPLPPGRSTRDTVLFSTNSPLITSITPYPQTVPSSSPSSEGGEGVVEEAGVLKGIGLPFWVWIIAGALLVAVTVIVVSCCYACKRNRQHRKQMKRRSDAEKVKQELLVDAKRMSYHEQMRWDSGRMDSGAVPATQEFSYNMTTFSDRN